MMRLRTFLFGYNQRRGLVSKKVLIALAVLILIVYFRGHGISRNWVHSFSSSRDNRDNTRDNRDNTNVASSNIPKKTCSFPVTDPWDPSIADMVIKYDPLKCTGFPTLLYQQDGFLKVNESKLEGLELNYCFYSTYTRLEGTDYHVKEIYTSKRFSINNPVKLRPEDSDIQAKCFDTSNKLISKMHFSFVLPQAEMEAERTMLLKQHKIKHGLKEVMSFLVVGVDGMSRSNFMRTMPKTRQFLVDDLRAIEMLKYNKVGSNTLPNVVPLLTGKHLKEFSESWEWDKPFDLINDAFIWTDLEKSGYRTAYAWELNDTTAFHKPGTGFIKRSVDFNNRAAVILSTGDSEVRSQNSNCLGDTSEIEVNANYIHQLASTFNDSKRTPYFGYVFNTRLTHGNSDLASSGDEIFHGVLKKLKDSNVLHNTVLVFFSDHGQRFGKIRPTEVGAIEGRTPFLFLAFPKWFRDKYPHMLSTLYSNRNRLTTLFDVYATLKDLQYFNNHIGRRTFTNHGISLFSEIPEDRSCEDAGVPFEHCACMFAQQTQVDTTTSQLLTTELLNHLIGLTENYRDKCHQFQIKTVLRVAQLVSPNPLEKVYSVAFQTNPGDCLFEGILALKSGSHPRVMGEVHRLNKYGNTAGCINDSNLWSYCYCYKY